MKGRKVDPAALMTRASEGFKRLNPHLMGSAASAGASPCAFSGPEATDVPISAPAGKKRKIRTSPVPKTRPEVEMSLILEKRKSDGEFASVVFEGITLLAGDGFRYSGDFVAIRPDGRVLIVEVKGPYLHRSGLQAFQSARALWPLFDFELWQLSSGIWSQLS